MAYRILQQGLFSSFSNHSDLFLYFKNFNGPFSEIDIKNRSIRFFKGGRVATDSYFNSFSIGKWKRRTNLKNLKLMIDFRGKFKITWYLLKLNNSIRFLDESYIYEEKESVQYIDIDFFDDIDDGILFFSIWALDDGDVYDFAYVTEQNPENKVKLAIVITHFNRQEAIIPAIERVKQELLDRDDYQNRAELFVVDNSQNLPEIPNVTIIKNPNIGGAGGFTRGLVYAQEKGSFTHCLFMDDDASCEVESIRRTIAILEYAKSSQCAISGAMLSDTICWRQFENGARFDNFCRPIKTGFDLRDTQFLLLNEEEEHIDYGAWWFFAFPISQVKHYAFPYFVRGDDIDFSLSHDFEIMSMNGIGSWQADFVLKSGPLPTYLDTRNHIMHRLHGYRPDSRFSLSYTMVQFFFKYALSYQYEGAKSVSMAMRDILKGPKFWRENVNLSQVRTAITSNIVFEKNSDIPFSIYSDAIHPIERESLTRKILRTITLNGHLIPKVFLNKGLVWQNKGFGGTAFQTFGWEKILFIHWPTHKGFIVHHNKSRFFSESLVFFWQLLRLTLRYGALKKRYQEAYQELTSAEFWQQQFKEKEHD